MMGIDAGRRAMRRGVIAAATMVVAGASAVSAQGNALLADVEMKLDRVTDSGDYLVYEYELVNPSASLSAVAGFSMDVATAAGAGHILLANTGGFDDGVSMRPSGTSFAAHVPFGAISPVNWQAFLMRFATIEWFGSRGGAVALDTVASGDSVAGFGVRSPYLPGLRNFAAEPSWQSCCAQASANVAGVNPGEHPSPESFAVVGVTVGPTRSAADFADAAAVLNAVSSDISEVCALGWIDRRTCRSITRNVNGAIKDLARGRTRGVDDILGRVLRTLESNHGDSVNDNAYWVLKVNLDYAIAQLANTTTGRRGGR